MFCDLFNLVYVATFSGSMEKYTRKMFTYFLGYLFIDGNS